MVKKIYIPKISIIIPVYNTEKYLDKCLESVTLQTINDIEIIVINDGSTDNSATICDEWQAKDSRIRVIHQANKGIAETRNIGVHEASAPYIGFVDSDDYISVDMFQSLYESIEKNNSDIAICGIILEFPTGKVKLQNTAEKARTYTTEEALHLLVMDHKIKSYCCNKIFKKSLFDGIKFPVGRYFEDHVSLYKLFAKANSISHTGENSYHYVQREGSILSSNNPKKEIDYFQANIEISDFINQSAIFSKKRKKIIAFKLQKRLLRAYSKLLKTTTQNEFLAEKEMMHKLIQQYTGITFNPEKIKQLLWLLSLKRLLIRVGFSF